MSYYRFHPKLWTDDQSQELCSQWSRKASFDKIAVKNPATNRKIRRGKARWTNIQRHCNQATPKSFNKIFEEFRVDTPTLLDLPNTTEFKIAIQDIANLWTDRNPLLNKISGYCGSDEKNDTSECNALFQTPQDTTDILCIESEESKQSEEKRSDTTRTLNGIATDFSTLNFFGTVKTRLQLINLVVTTFNFFLEELRTIDPELFSEENVTLMFKGGVTLRLIIRELLNNFSGDLEQIVFYNIHKSLKISDYDFELSSRKDTLTPEQMIKMNLLTYLVILALRNYVIQHKLHFFNFFRLKEGEQQKKIFSLKERLQDEIDNIDDADNFYSGVTIEHVQYGGECHKGPASGQFDSPLTDLEKRSLPQFKPKEELNTSPCRTDFALVIQENTFTGEAPGCFITAKNLLKAYNLTTPARVANLPLYSRSEGSRFYATHNPQIYARVGVNTTQFNLNRIKYDFTLYCSRKNGELFRSSVVGEILDLSHAGSEDRRKSFDPVFPSDKTRKYKFFGYDLEFKSYSLAGFYQDLNSILFPETNWQPWTDLKYKKRIYRIIYVCVLHFFSVELDSDLTYLERLQYMNTIIDALQTNKTLTIQCRQCRSASLLTKLGQELDKVKETAVIEGLLNESVYTEFIDTVLATFIEIRDVLQEEYELTRDPHFSIGAIQPSDLAIEYPDAYW